MSTARAWLVQGLVRPLLPIVLALLTIAVLLLAIGNNPAQFFGEVISYGVLGSGWQNSLTMMAPLMLIALGLIVAFRSGIWNLGYDGQFLIPAVLVAGLGPWLVTVLPIWAATAMLIVLAILAGALWALLPAWLKVKRGANEIVTTLALSFIAVGVANLLIRGVFHDAQVLVPQTQVLPQWALLPFIPGTRVHVGVLLALAVVIIGHLILTRTSIGIRIDVLGTSPRAAREVGIRTGLVTLLVFMASGALIGLAGATDLLGVWGYARTDWNPAYGMAVIPFVLIARLNALAVLPLLAAYSIFATGATIAAQHAEVSVDLITIMVALILGFMAVSEWMFSKTQSSNAAFWQRTVHRGASAQEQPA